MEIDSKFMRGLFACAVLWPVVLWSVAAQPAQAQPPEEFHNLKVLPKDISKDELIETMRGFSMGLGVRCLYCHVGSEEAKSVWDNDFVSDDKPAKQTARMMMQMMREINRSHLPKLDKPATELLKVSCATCHRRQTRPMRLSQTLATTLETEGVEATVARYHELREEHYGSDAYDFSDRSLRELASTLSKSGRPEDALVFVRLNLELYPESLRSHVTLAELLLETGDKPGALASYERALELVPGDEYLIGKIEELKAVNP